MIISNNISVVSYKARNTQVIYAEKPQKQKHGYLFLIFDQTKLSRVPLKIGHSHLCMRGSLELTLTVPLRIPYNQDLN